jgi:S-adenosylmethionine synthetase
MRAVRFAVLLIRTDSEPRRFVHVRTDFASALRINTLDAANADGEKGIYLTVTGTSAEQADDGQVGRGNRVGRLITPSRPMSLEAVEGKNPVSHVWQALQRVVIRDCARPLDGSARPVRHAA